MNDKEYIEKCWNEIKKNKTRNDEIYWGARHPKQQNQIYYNKRGTYTKKKRHLFNKFLMCIAIIEEIGLAVIMFMMASLPEVDETGKEILAVLCGISIIKIIFIFRGRNRTEYINYNS